MRLAAKDRVFPHPVPGLAGAVVVLIFILILLVNRRVQFACCHGDWTLAFRIESLQMWAVRLSSIDHRCAMRRPVIILFGWALTS